MAINLTIAARGALIAAGITLLQSFLVPVGFIIGQFELMGPLAELLILSYFFSAFPAGCLRIIGIDLSGGFFGWPTTAGFLVGLLIWFLLYWAVAMSIIEQ